MRARIAARAVAGAGIACALALVASFVLSISPPALFVGPASILFPVVPGRYVIWHEYHTVFHEQPFHLDPALPPGVRLKVTGPDGTPLALEPADGERWVEGAVRRQAVARFRVRIPGPCVVSLSGGAEAYVIAVQRDLVKPTLETLGGALILCVLGLVFGVAIYAFARRSASAAE